MSAGPVITLTSKPVAPLLSASQSDTANTFSTSTLSATFNVHIKALGGAVVFGTAASATPAFASSTSGFVVYANSVANTSFRGYATTTSYTFPSVCTTSGLTNSCSLAENSEMDVPVLFFTKGRVNGGADGGASVAIGSYAVQMAGVHYVIVPSTGTSSAGDSTFMNGLVDWRTNEVTFP
jgi:hypothetical protein